METIVKQTREVGTSAGVLLPRRWLNKQVVVTLLNKSKEEITKDIIEILVNKNLNEDIKGVYLVGSYARGDYSPESDIDVLVLTKETNKIIDSGKYEITLISEENLSKFLPTNLYYFSMIKEAKPLINKDLIEKYSNRKIKLKTNRMLKDIKNMVKINKENVELCEDLKDNVSDGVVYSIILRLRELYLLRCLSSNKIYHKKDFMNIVGERFYETYSRAKQNEREMKDTSPEEAKILLNLSEKWLKELKE